MRPSTMGLGSIEGLSKLGCLALSLMLLTGLSHACGMKSVWEPFEPYQFMNKHGQPTGLDIDLLNAVATEAGCQLDIDHIPWKRAQAMMSIGTLDVASGASKTQQREQYAHFSVPYRSEQYALFLRSDDAGEFIFTNLSELAQTEARIGGLHGYFYGESFSELEKAKKFKGGISLALSGEQNIKRLKSRVVDIILLEAFVGSRMLQSELNSGEIVRHDLLITTGDIYFMFSKKKR